MLGRNLGDPKHGRLYQYTKPAASSVRRWPDNLHSVQRTVRSDAVLLRTQLLETITVAVNGPLVEANLFCSHNANPRFLDVFERAGFRIWCCRKDADALIGMAAMEVMSEMDEAVFLVGDIDMADIMDMAHAKGVACSLIRIPEINVSAELVATADNVYWLNSAEFTRQLAA